MTQKVGIIIVSHSFQIGEGVKVLIDQVIEDVPISLACGTEDNDIGTSIEKIQGAIEQVASDSGAIIFYDLGSAKMNAEMAIELLESSSIRIAEEIPVVEGSYIAAVESNLGKSLEEIMSSLEKIKINM
ncbi:PTS-dependent dihydroxyacetone kinase phosphotransferase subunit DhaM [Gracilibacillus salitolerans]|uniref:phosphoenolpyruvate--glycerone phosphotransferase n=1 Tax=Gracilibacillus salitolerans TaxID=2663022 RepID=A0A5Q2TGI4_9BACI|nr:dihydroxyacetone kinase phosphoryl donor subunit DhaM [Gracilibacillus salitolerans]QGH33929.1 PTS-dependent dihydroxyacetone kinase phosphotransferase subunit DhaM [Gracilibacillus salitolerans]